MTSVVLLKLAVFFLNSEHVIIRLWTVGTRHGGLLSAVQGQVYGLESSIKEKRATPR